MLTLVRLVMLVGEGHLVPGVTADEFKARRQAARAFLGEGEVVLLLAAPEQFVAGVVPHPYRPDPDLHYLTGIQQKEVSSYNTTTLCQRNGRVDKLCMYIGTCFRGKLLV